MTDTSPERDNTSPDEDAIRRRRAAAGLAGAAGAGAVAGAIGASEITGRRTSPDGDEALHTEGAGEGDDTASGDNSLDVFDDIESDDAIADDPATGPGAASISAARAEIAPPTPGTTYDGLGDDPRRVGPRGDSSTPTASSSAAADATVIAATETGATGVAGAPSPLPTAPLINRPAQPQPQPVEPAAASSAPAPPPPQPIASQGPAPQPGPEPAVMPPSVQQAPAPDQSSGSGGIDAIDDVVQPPTESSGTPSSSTSSSVATQPTEADVTPTGPAAVPSDGGLATSTDTGDSSSAPDTGAGYGAPPATAPGDAYPPAHDAAPGYDATPPDQAAPPVQQADPGYGMNPPGQAVPPAQPVDPGYGQQYPPVKGKAPIKDDVKDDDQDVAPPYYPDGQQDDDQVVDAYLPDDDDQYIDEPVVDEEPVVYAPYYKKYPGDSPPFEHPATYYGEPDPPGPNQAANVSIYGGGMASIIRDDNGNETITWYSAPMPDGYVEFAVYVTHDGAGTYTEAITSHSLYYVDALLGSMYYDGQLLEDPDVTYGKENAEQVIDAHLITRTWTDEDGNLVIKKMHRDGSGKIEITFGNGLYVVYQDGEHTYVAPGEQFPGDLGAVPGEEVAPDLGAGVIGDAEIPLVAVDAPYLGSWAAHYDTVGGYSHPYHSYGQPGYSGYESDGVFLRPDGTYVYQFNNGRVTVERDPDGNETITWYAQNGNDRYIDFQTYYSNGWVDVIVPRLVTHSGSLAWMNLGSFDIDGTEYVDPWETYGMMDDPWGLNNDDPAYAVLINAKTVVQTWQTDDGPITKTSYRGENWFVIEYPDGVVITRDSLVNNGEPTYKVPGEPEHDMGIRYFASDLFGETYGHPADIFPDGPIHTELDGAYEVDYYPDGTSVTHYRGFEHITWYDSDGNIGLVGSALFDGTLRIDHLPWYYILETNGIVLDPITTSHGVYYDPEGADMSFEQTITKGFVRHRYEDGTVKTYNTSAAGPGWVTIQFPDGTTITWNGTEIHSVHAGTGEHAQPVSEQDEQMEGYTWPMGGPEEFTLSEGVSIANPEHDNEFEYSHASEDGKTLFYRDSNGYQAVIQDMGTYYTVFYGPNPPAEIDAVVNMQPDGTYTVPYYPAGEDDDNALEPTPSTNLGGLSPEDLVVSPGLPDFDPVIPGRFENQNTPAYPKIIQWNDNPANGWVVLEMEDGRILEHRIGDPNTYQWHPDAGNPTVIAQSGPQLLYVESNGTAYFQTDSSQTSFYMINSGGGETPVSYSDLPFVLPGTDLVFTAVEPDPPSEGSTQVAAEGSGLTGVAEKIGADVTKAAEDVATGIGDTFGQLFDDPGTELIPLDPVPEDTGPAPLPPIRPESFEPSEPVETVEPIIQDVTLVEVTFTIANTNVDPIDADEDNDGSDVP